MPKIDWRDDDQPRVERFARPQRRRMPLAVRARASRAWDFGAPSVPIDPSAPATRRPLHLIWGPPERVPREGMANS